jgi:hypothetical protein
MGVGLLDKGKPEVDNLMVVDYLHTGKPVVGMKDTWTSQQMEVEIDQLADVVDIDLLEGMDFGRDKLVD